MSSLRRRSATVRRLEQATGALASAAIARMEESLPWYRAMPPEHRSWVGLVAQAGIAAFTAWFRRPEASPRITADVFGTAPRELVRAVSLQQTVELVRSTIEVVEQRVDELAAPGSEAELREAVLRYSREIAFAAAQVYAEAAEARGAWDARLEALVVDALLRGEADEALRSRAAALGWGSSRSVAVVAGNAPRAAADEVVDRVQRTARDSGLDVLSGVHGERLVAILGGLDDPLQAARSLVGQFGAGPVVVGPLVEDLAEAAESAAAAMAGVRAAVAWPGAPRPVLAEDLLPERALDGDAEARRRLVEEVYRPLQEADATLLATVTTYLEQAGGLEATARMLFVHPNTVRYRLRRVQQLTGQLPTTPRGAFGLRLALALGRLGEAGPGW